MRAGRFRAAVTALAFVAVPLFVPAAAPACGCDPSQGSVVVAHGSSPAGVPWRWKAREYREAAGRRSALLSFSSGAPNDPSGDGFSSGVPLPLWDGPVVHGISSGIAAPSEGEPSLAGFAQRKAAFLRAQMSDGTVLPIDRELPPPALQRRLPWLGSLAFFNAFYDYGVEPLSVLAYAADGRVIGKERLAR